MVNYTYTVNGDSYIIYNNGNPWIIQNSSNTPSPAGTLEDSAKLHVASQYQELKNSKISELNSECNKAITDGVDVELASGTKHFSLKTFDQINIMSLRGSIMAGAPSVPYHADGEDCMLYTAAEFTAIANAVEQHIKKHQTFFNQLKKQTNAMTDYSRIDEIEYTTAVLTGECLNNYMTIMNT